MAIPELSCGAIQGIMEGDKSKFLKPVVQILGQKSVAGGNKNPDRFRLLISDGIHTYASAMLATQLNHLVQENKLPQHTIIRLEKYLCNEIPPNRRVMIILEVTILASADVVGQKIGDPKAFNKSGENQPPPQHQQPPPPPKIVNGGHVPKTPEQRKPAGGFYGSRAQPTRAVGAAAAAAATNSPRTPGGTPLRVSPIESLTPYQNRWTIKARVTHKSDVRNYSNSRNQGKLFNFNLLDETGEIRCTGFNEQLDKFYDLIEVNKVYFISRCTLKTANKQFNNTNNEYEMTLNSDSEITLCEEVSSLPKLKCKFVPINTLMDHAPNSVIDVIGIVHDAAEVSTITTKSTNREMKKRDLQLVDKSGSQIRLTIWGSEAERFDGNGKPVLAVKGAKVSDWNGRSLSSLGSSQMWLNPEMDEAYTLRGWYDSEGAAMDFAEYSRGDGAAPSGGSMTNWKTLREAKELDTSEKAQYYTAKATILMCKKDNCMYQACPGDSCNKKVVDQGDGTFRCEKCQQSYPNFQYRLILRVNMADETEQIWVTCFQESAEQLLGCSSEQLGRWKDSDDPLEQQQFEAVFQDACFQTFIFRLRAKTENYNDEDRVKTTCMEAKPLDFTEHSRRLVDDIERLLAS